MAEYENRDNLPAGQYVYDYETRGFHRVGPGERLRRYHGTALPEGAAIDEFQPSSKGVDDEFRPTLAVTPAIYTTDDLETALDYAGAASVGNEHEQQLYVVEIDPGRTVDLGECTDDESIQDALTAKFDTVDCPEFPEQRETITFDAEKVKPLEMYPVTGRKTPDFSKPALTLDELVQDGQLGPPTMLSQPRQTGSITTAIEEYTQAKDKEHSGVDDMGVSRSVEYRGMPNRPRMPIRRGRGSIRY